MRIDEGEKEQGSTRAGRWPGSSSTASRSGLTARSSPALLGRGGDPLPAVLRLRGDPRHLRRRARARQLAAVRVRAAHRRHHRGRGASSLPAVRRRRGCGMPGGVRAAPAGAARRTSSSATRRRTGCGRTGSGRCCSRAGCGSSRRASVPAGADVARRGDAGRRDRHDRRRCSRTPTSGRPGPRTVWERSRGASPAGRPRTAGAAPGRRRPAHQPVLDPNPVDLAGLDEVRRRAPCCAPSTGRCRSQGRRRTPAGPALPRHGAADLERAAAQPRASPAASSSWSGCATSSAPVRPWCRSRRRCTGSAASARPRWPWSTCTGSWPTTTWCGGSRRADRRRGRRPRRARPSASARRPATTWRPPPRRPSTCCGAGCPSRAGCWSSTTPTTPRPLKRFFPQGGPGHVLITSRNQAWSAVRRRARRSTCSSREECVEHLHRRAPGLSTEDAEQVAAAVGDLPLAVEQAAAWLAETATPVPRTSSSWPSRPPTCWRSTSRRTTPSRWPRPGTSPSTGSRRVPGRRPAAPAVRLLRARADLREPPLQQGDDRRR